MFRIGLRHNEVNGSNYSYLSVILSYHHVTLQGQRPKEGGQRLIHTHSLSIRWKCLGSFRSQVMEDLQNGGQGPGLGLTAEGAVLAILIGQLRQTLPGRFF